MKEIFFGDLLKLPTGIVRTIMKKTFQIDFVLSAQCLKICFGKTYVTITKHFLKKIRFIEDDRLEEIMDENM